MGLFTRRQPNTVVPSEVLEGLAAFGRARLRARREGKPVEDAFGWSFVGPVVNASFGPTRDQVLQELYDAALTAEERELSIFGAYNLLSESQPTDRDGRFLELLDASLDYMHGLRFSSGHLTGYEAERWVELHGDLRSSFDHIVHVEVPRSGDNPPLEHLPIGESKLLALTEPLPNGNAFYAERVGDGRYVIFSERPRSDDDRTRCRSDESYLGRFDDLEGLFVALGRMFGTKPYWADDLLEPYFPGRRS